MFNMDVINIILVAAIIALVILSIVLLIKRLRKRGELEKADLSPLYETSSNEDDTIEGAAKKVQRATGIRQDDMNKVVGALKISTDKMEELAKKTFSDRKDKVIKNNVVKTSKSRVLQKTEKKEIKEKVREDDLER